MCGAPVIEGEQAVPDLARRGGGKPPRLRSRSDAEQEIARVEKLGARFLVLGQGLYPRLLAGLEDAPPLLIAKGDLKLLDKPARKQKASPQKPGPRDGANLLQQ